MHNLIISLITTMKTIIKPFITMVALVLLAAGSVRATVDIPDGNPIGVDSTLNVSGISLPITSVSITLNISGGNNGDLVAYLSYDGQLVTLFNQPGVSTSNPLGATDPGFVNVTFADSVSANPYTGNG